MQCGGTQSARSSTVHFVKFVFQHGEFRGASSSNEREELARFFARRLLEWDLDDTEMWAVIGLCGNALKTFLATGKPGLMQTIDAGVRAASGVVMTLPRTRSGNTWQDEIGVLRSNLALAAAQL